MAIFTLWSTLEQYKVVIPIIQRDYAQGRKDDRQIEQIRKGFVKNLFNHLILSKPLELDFIYGALHQGELELLDGQQRLTTLFLLHWYLANRTHQKLQESKIKKQLNRFSYQTRSSSRMFITELIEHGHEIFVNDQNNLSSLIENEAWYLAVWKKDPTVISMLIMLDEIHKQFINIKEINAEVLWEALTVKEILRFYLLPMNDFALSEELYIKMNARGVQLTEFENFKAWLQGRLEQTGNSDMIKNFFNKIDREWADYLWTLNQSENNDKGTKIHPNFNFDAMYMQFFKSCLLCQSYALATRNVKAEHTYDKDEKSLVSRLRKNLIITIDEYTLLLDEDSLQIKLIQNISMLFEFFQNYLGKVNIKKILLHIFNSENSSYEDQAQFSILYFYCIYINNADQFDDWFNIANRLVKNAKNYFNAEKDLVSVLEVIEHLALKIGTGNVLETISSLTESSEIFKKLTTAFDILHIQNEIEKADLILRDPTWKLLLKKYEDHKYFYGEIGFLISYCKDENKIASMDVFKKYAEIAEKLFQEDILKDSSYRLHRALLSFGEIGYLVKDGSNLSFCREVFNTVRRRNENWRKVFEHRRAILKKLFDRLGVDFEIKDLENIINKNKSLIKDWRIYFMEFPEAIEYCRKYQVRFVNSETIFLLSSKQMNGAHAELRTYVLYLKLLKNGFEKSLLHYDDVTTSTENPSLIIKIDALTCLKVQFVAGKFKNEFVRKNTIITEESDQLYLELIARQDFSQVIALEHELESLVVDKIATTSEI